LSFSSRDNGRTPMQWDNTLNAGFSSGIPWLPVNNNYQRTNVQAEDKDSTSILNHFKRMVALRKSNPILIYGKYQILQREHPDIYAYRRELKNESVLVLLNFTSKNSSIILPELKSTHQVLINNYGTYFQEGEELNMKPYQALIFMIK
ncbi:MAG: alpha-glucosidase C-terminal domain-containing protein, partial [Saprospiraceae bacterium]